MHLVIARAKARAETREQLTEALVNAARTARTEAGCRSYEFFTSLEDPNSFVSVEEWDDRASIDAHFATPALAALMQSLPDLVAAPPTIDVHEIAATSGPPGS